MNQTTLEDELQAKFMALKTIAPKTPNEPVDRTRDRENLMHQINVLEELESLMDLYHYIKNCKSYIPK